jgi:hypothetical protein
MILEAVGLNYTLTSGKVAFLLEQPLVLVAEANGSSNWSGLVDDVRTLIVERGLNVGRFERALRALDGIVPDVAEAA